MNLFLLLLLNLALFPFLLPLEPVVGFSFILTSIAASLLFIYTRKRFSVTNVSILIYYLFFFIVAPLVQLNNRGDFRLINTVPYDSTHIVVANILIALFLLIYILARMYFDKKKNYYVNSRVNFDSVQSVLSTPKLIFFSLLIVLITYDYWWEQVSLFAFSILSTESLESGMLSLIFEKFLFSMPIGFLIYIIVNPSIGNRKLLFMFALFLVVAFKNPIIEHRNGFGVAYLMISWVMLRHYINTSYRLLGYMGLSFAVLFPLGELLSPHRFTDEKIDAYGLFFEVYNNVHFDSWANVVATIRFVSESGFTFGSQILSTMLFWVPRDLWLSKGVASSSLLAEYMIDQHSFWMTNISFPIVAEAYLDFSVLGVMLYAVLIAKLSSWLDNKFLFASFPVALASLYFSFHYIFLARGPLLSSLAYSLGSAMGIYIFCLVCRKRLPRTFPK